MAHPNCDVLCNIIPSSECTFILNCLVDCNLRSQLFGHEILAVLCGLVWGAMIGFAITATGTFIGEVANF